VTTRPQKGFFDHRRRAHLKCQRAFPEPHALNERVSRDGYVVWAENYDRPKADQLKVQDEIAIEVARALRDSVR